MLIRPSGAESLHDLWEKYELDPDFFKGMQLADDGGFDSTPLIYNRTTPIFAVVAGVVLMLNVGALTLANYSILYGESTFTDWCADESEEYPFFLLREPLRALTRQFTQVDIFELKGCKTFIRPEVLIAFVEFVFAVLLLLRFWFLIIFSCCHQEVGKWHSIASMFWTVVPRLQGFSALWVLNEVTPTVLANRLDPMLEDLDRPIPNVNLPRLRLALYIVRSLIMAVLAIDVFIIKVWMVANAVQFKCSVDPAAQCDGVVREDTCLANLESQCFFERVWQGLMVIVLLNQLYGFRRDSWLIRRLFGREEKQLTNQDHAVWMTWQAMITEKLWHDHSCVQFMALMLTISDQDVGHLIVISREDSPEAKEKKAAAAARRAENEGDSDGDDEDVAMVPSQQDWRATTVGTLHV